MLRSSKKSRASSFGSSTRRPEGSAMPPASSRATRQARYSASTARAAFGAAAGELGDLRLGHRIEPSNGSAKASRRPTSSCRSPLPDSVAEIDPQRLGQLDQQRWR